MLAPPFCCWSPSKAYPQHEQHGTANLISGQFYTDLPLYATYRLLPDNRPAGLAPLVTEHMI